MWSISYFADNSEANKPSFAATEQLSREVQQALEGEELVLREAAHVRARSFLGSFESKRGQVAHF